MATPSWDDINKLTEQNMQLCIWINEQKIYIRSLTNAIPKSLLDDLAATLPPLPNIPELIALWEPKRILKSPIDDSQPFMIQFPEKPFLPPRESSTEAMKFKTGKTISQSKDMIDDSHDILDHYPATGSNETTPIQIMQEHEMLYLAYESAKDNDNQGSSIKLKNLQDYNVQDLTQKEMTITPEREEIQLSDDHKYKIHVLYTTRALTPKGKEAMALILSVTDSLTNEELFKLDKQYSHLAILDVYLRKKESLEDFPPLPEKFLFQTFAPYKFDLRKNAVETYLNYILERCANWREVKMFLKSNKYEPVKSSFVMEGFLFRKEKQGSSWKARYYYIKDGSLGFSDRRGEPQVSSIDMKNMTVTRLSDNSPSTENDYCHAFMLYESQSSTSDLNLEKQHSIFCCENNKERDLWVLHLGNEIVKYRPKDNTVTNELSDLKLKDDFSRRDDASRRDEYPRRLSSKESNLNKSDSGGNHPGMIPISEQVGEINLIDSKNTMGKGFFKNKNVDKPLPQTKRVFGNTLANAVAVSQISKTFPIPAIIYRCIEYLEHQRAWQDEGIYRLSGMSTEINYLKGKYETDLDFDLIHQEKMFDTNAVAGLLKLYLRELPEPLFSDNFGKADGGGNLEQLQMALAKIPYLNYILLRTIFGHLAQIIKHSDVNKMTPQNLSIIFSPTLQLSPTIFSSFLQDFESVFCREEIYVPENS